MLILPQNDAFLQFWTYKFFSQLQHSNCCPKNLKLETGESGVMGEILRKTQENTMGMGRKCLGNKGNITLRESL